MARDEDVARDRTRQRWNHYVSVEFEIVDGLTTRSHARQPTGADLEYLAAGKLRPVIERTFPLAEAADAFWIFATGRVKGKLVPTV